MPKESKESKTAQNAENKLESVFDDVALVDPKGDAIAALKDLLKRAPSLGIEAADSEEFTVKFMEFLHKESRTKLLHDFIEREVVKSKAAKRRNLEHINDLAEDADKGGYPYIHEYDEKLYEDELFNLQVELLKLQRHVLENKQ